MITKKIIEEQRKMNKNKSFMFESYRQFIEDDTPIFINCNGVTQRFLDEHDITLKEYEKMNESNLCCFNCYKCKNCINCEGCHECINCEKCMRCNKCTKCNNTIYSSKCKKCSNCELCTRCENCKKCQRCEDCLSCSKCCDYKKNTIDMLNIIHVKGLY